jgi:hypothetical protein
VWRQAGSVVVVRVRCRLPRIGRRPRVAKSARVRAAAMWERRSPKLQHRSRRRSRLLPASLPVANACRPPRHRLKVPSLISARRSSWLRSLGFPAVPPRLRGRMFGRVRCLRPSTSSSAFGAVDRTPRPAVRELPTFCQPVYQTDSFRRWSNAYESLCLRVSHRRRSRRRRGLAR